MANCSDAYGTITLKGSRLTKEALIEVIHSTQAQDCYFTDFDKKNAMKKAAEEETTFDFCGCGRWSYHLNIENMFEWIEHDIKIDYIKAEDKQIVKDAWNYLKNEDWEIIFDYKDEECGLDVLYEEESKIVHKAGANKADVIVLNDAIYEHTPENLMKLGYTAGAEYLEESSEE